MNILNQDTLAPKQKRLVVVLGMHRSGTSAITRGLQALGVELGEALIGGIPGNNAKGFWEDSEINAFNNELLNHFGRQWHSLSPVPEAPCDEAMAAFRLRALKLLRGKAKPGVIFGIKDPRISRLLSFWQPLFEHDKYKVDYIIAVRHPFSVADSLTKRDAFDPEKSCMLWLEHQVPAVLRTAGYRRVVVSYDQLLEDPPGQLKRIADALELEYPSPEALQEYSSDFLDTELRHSLYHENDISLNPDMSASLGLVYASLLAAARAAPDETLDQLTEVMAGVEPILDELAPVYKLVDRQGQVIVEVSCRLDDLKSVNDQLSLLTDEQSARLAEIAQRNNELDLLVASLGRELETSCTDLAEAIDKLNKGTAEIARLEHLLVTELTQRDQALEAALTEKDQAFENAIAQKDQLFESALAQRQRELEALIGQKQSELDAVRVSRSWRVTAPLRAVRLHMPSVSKMVRGPLSDGSRWLWHNLPVSVSFKLRIKDRLFRRAPALFSWSQAYRSWHGLNFESASGSFETVYDDNRLASAPKPARVGDYVPLLRAPEPTDLPVRLIAFYLPQFHAIAENDEWWGEGFTEWTNVRPAQPQFEGHYQPHVPGELGYYNLLSPEVQRRQVELAKLYGVGGFCFYYYWFAGQRLLEQPIDRYLADEALDLPFCLCWANENWSRRWDGLDSQVLMAQAHSEEDDLAIAADLARHMRDARYIRIGGKPLLIVYRPSLLPSARETSERWRKWFRANGIGEIYLAYTQSFETEDPTKYGFDAAIEFPPNNSAPPNITAQVKPLSDVFAGTVYDWSVFPERAQRYKATPYRLFRSVCPSWDNTARRKGRGTVFLNSTPEAYGHWLKSAIAETCNRISEPDERLVFVNAWNEWAEGAHLEPDQKYGYAWLDATRKALTNEPEGPYQERIAVVSHDAHPHGAQFLALGMVRSLSRELKLDVHTVLLGEGRLRSEFLAISTVHDLQAGPDDWKKHAYALAAKLAGLGVTRAFVNTTVAGHFAEVLTEQGIICVNLVHEMPGVIEANGLAEAAQRLAGSVHRVVFPAPVVAEGFARFANVDPNKQIIRPQGLWRRNSYRLERERIRFEVRDSLRIAADAPVVLAVGYADRRKGVDLFAKAALRILASRPDTAFIWIGHGDDLLRKEVDLLIRGHEKSFHFLGYQPDTARYHTAADVYALTSREDPFPNVVLESFDAGVPVIAFAGTGGGAELVAKTGGYVVALEDCDAFAVAVEQLLAHQEHATELGKEASEMVDRDYAFCSYLYDLCAYAGLTLPKISVIVPNYNYAHHIRDRLDSILAQTLPIYELIILDDASTDNSLAVIGQWLRDHSVECRLIVNDRNSGCVSDQWAKGVELATGDFVWIAEADDLSEKHFLETVLSPMERDPSVNLSYCESNQIDYDGNVLARNYKDYVSDISETRWDVAFCGEGREEVERCLAIKNTIPNVSAVLFRRERLAQVFAEDLQTIRALRRAGDWVVYAKVLQQGKIAFDPLPLNHHRRHTKSVIGSDNGQALIDEIETVQALVASDHQFAAGVQHQAERYLRHLRSQVSA